MDGHGWQTASTTLNQLLADNGLPEIPVTPGDSAFTENYYRIAVRRP